MVVGQEALFVELDSQFRLFPFGNQIGQKRFEYRIPVFSTDLSHIEAPMPLWISEMTRSVVVHRESERVTEQVDRSWIGHLYTEREDVSFRSSVELWSRIWPGSLDGNTTFSIKQTGEIGQANGISVGRDRHSSSVSCLHHYSKQERHSELSVKKSANSVDLRPRNGEDNTEPSISRKREGVCREHRPTPKGMMCSDLRGNTQSAAEMTAPLAPRQEVTKSQDAKTAHILWYGGIGISNRRKQGVMGGIDTTLTS